MNARAGRSGARSAARGRRAALLALTLLVLLAAVAVGVVAYELWIETEARSSLDEAFERPIRSARVELVAALRLEGVGATPGRLRIRASGPLRLAGRRPVLELDWRVAVERDGASTAARVTSAGGRTVITLGGRSYDAGPGPAEAAGAILPAARGGEGAGSARLEPRAWLEGVRREGEWIVAGTPVERFGGTVRVDRLLDDWAEALGRGPAATLPLPPLPTAAERRDVALALRGTRAVVHVGRADGAVRGLDVRGRLGIPEARRAEARGIAGGEVSLSLRLLDVDREQRIPAPPPAGPLG